LSYINAILFNKIQAGAVTLSDILVLAVKEKLGKLRSDEGFLSATGDLATLTANSGKEMYIARAQIIYFSNQTTAVNGGCEVVLKINGTIVETTNFSTDIRGPIVYEFKNIGHKVAATEIIKLEVISLDTPVDVEGFIECFEETTGVNPLDDFK